VKSRFAPPLCRRQVSSAKFSERKVTLPADGKARCGALEKLKSSAPLALGCGAPAFHSVCGLSGVVLDAHRGGGADTGGSGRFDANQCSITRPTVVELSMLPSGLPTCSASRTRSPSLDVLGAAQLARWFPDGNMDRLPCQMSVTARVGTIDPNPMLQIRRPRSSRMREGV
jgi:hypothetical protein